MAKRLPRRGQLRHAPKSQTIDIRRTYAGTPLAITGSHTPESTRMRIAPHLAAAAFATIAATVARAAPICAQRTIPIDSNQIWADLEGQGKTTVVFEAGFGNDSSVWAKITPKIRAAGVRTLVYDRPGMGRSTFTTKTRYSLQNDALTLKTLLTACNITAPIVFVGHSYGGAIGLFDAQTDNRIAGLVLVDAVVPHVNPPAEIAANLAQMRAQYEDILIEAPNLARVAIPFAEKFTATNQTIDAIQIPNTLPVIDIVAGNGRPNPAAQQAWEKAHADFAKAKPNREEIMASQSKHKVMDDNPDLVIRAILKMVSQVSK
jgi:pimeloyl-ACP methyl ester carboxylesterase